MSTTSDEITEQEPDTEPETQDDPAEPDTDADEPGNETEPEPEPEQTPEPPADFEKAIKQLDKENTRHANRVSEIMGEDAQALTVCPLCAPVTAGFVFADAIPDDHKANVIGWLRGSDLPEMLPDPDAQLCDICGGHGHTLTGSPIPGNDTKLCGKCAGLGWTSPEQRQQWTMMHPPAQTIAPPPTPAPPAVPSYNGMPATDIYGRPVGTEFYGRDPNYMTPDERARDPYSPN